MLSFCCIKRFVTNTKNWSSVFHNYIFCYLLYMELCNVKRKKFWSIHVYIHKQFPYLVISMFLLLGYNYFNFVKRRWNTYIAFYFRIKTVNTFKLLTYYRWTNFKHIKYLNIKRLPLFKSYINLSSKTIILLISHLIFHNFIIACCIAA